MNTPIIGRIYHVIDKTTGEVVKVGSTIRTLEMRFKQSDYKNKYTNHFLRVIRTIQSSELDWYESKNALCPFLWHLVAAENLEIARMDTFQKTSFSNQVSPLAQKLWGLDGVIGGSIGGKIGGKRTIELYGNPSTPEGCRKGGHLQGQAAVESGQLAEARSIRTPEEHREFSRRGGLANVESGHIAAVGRAHGKIQGRKNVESGLLEKIRPAAGRKGGPIAMHNRWHVKRGIISSTCKLCNPVINS